VTLTEGGMEPGRKTDRLFLISGDGRAGPYHAAGAGLAAPRTRRGHAFGRHLFGGLCAGEGRVPGQHGNRLHWAWHDLFTEEFPEVRLVRNVFVAREKVITASGGTAAADLMLHLIGRAHGEDLATEVADQMVYNAVREGTAAQRVSLQSRHGMRNQHLVRAIAIMDETIEDPISPSLIAEQLGISTRQLERLPL
jgi:hypothetical protein